MRKRDLEILRNGIVMAVFAIIICVTTVLYSVFTSNQIFTESVAHLSEIYGQVNTTFQQKVSDYRNLMRSWEQYIINMTSDPERHEEFNDYVQNQKAVWGFTDFYLVNIDSDNDDKKAIGMRADGVTIADLEFRREIDALLGGEDVGVSGTRTDQNGNTSSFVMFAVPFSNNQKYTFNGFEYSAISIIFNAQDLQNALDVKAFADSGICYIVLPDGDILLQSRGDLELKANYLEFLENECKITQSSIDTIKADWEKENDKDKTGSALFKTKSDGNEYYLTYMSVEFSDWMLLGVVPSDIVNSNMSNFRLVTIIVMAVIFICILAAVLILLILLNRQRLRDKEYSVRSREGILTLLTQNTNDLFILFRSEHFKADYVSPNLNQVLGLDVGEVKADIRNILKAAINAPKPFTKEGLAKLGKGDIWGSEIRMRHVDTNQEYWYQMMLKHSLDTAEDGFVLVLSDRTKEKKMSQNLAQALDIAKSANEAKSNFLSNMSHDIRTPMNAIIGFATLLAKDAENPDKVREYIRKIMFSGQHLLSLINDILDMSKIESGKTSLNIEEMDFSNFLEEIGSIIGPQARAKHQEFEIHSKGVLPERVYGDKLRINQIMLNLLSNAVKYTPDGGRVVFTVEVMSKSVHNHAHLKFIVEDNGLGMSPEFLQKIFEPFSRESSAATREIQGTGLGMTITKNIVDLMGGTISVESELNRGSKFTVELELAFVEHGDIDSELFWAEHNIYKILVVDDEEYICEDVAALMEGTGVEISAAYDGMTAVEKVKAAKDEKPFNLVLLDWKMPGMDGVETAKRIREIVGKDLPIMVLTSYSFDEIEDEAKEAGIDLFLPKPFFVSNFRHAVKQLKKDGSEDNIAAQQKSVSMEGLHVLAAEDNEINAEILEELLDIEGVTCDLAENGKIALEKFEKSEKGQYDLIFMDIQMPVMNGLDAARAIRASAHPEAKTIPIIAMTANAFDDDVNATLDAGMNAHLAKPINMDNVKEIVVSILGADHERE